MARSAITIKDVAREADVSVATVSRALNGHENVAEAVRQHVIATASRLRYQPHAAARSLSSRRTQTIGVVLPDLHGEFFSELIRGIDTVARARGQHLLLSSYHGNTAEQGEALKAMRGRVDGLLLLSPYHESGGFLQDNLPPLLPAVLINTRQDNQDYPSLSIDNFGGAVEMVRHLLQSGHRRIAFIAGPEDNFDAHERQRGFRQAMQERDDTDAWELAGDFSEASGYRAGKAIADAEALPDAVFAANDMMALGCLFALGESGLQVPARVALAGFDDIPLARFVHPPLTTMQVSIAGLGERAMTRLLDQIDDNDTTGQRSQMLSPTLVVRGSSQSHSPPPAYPAGAG
ncbi:LacI family DNA-binding transcriptional regulator [Pseudoxanthomonas dokdonensis]|uniref:LacI family transcriptional regulator n=1 Tax=Pseudoxanthomonas dokdonensis TaxID=344882 RepID=A0A0R0CG70_9GAMM|nr:LacI family DNA-binding transcriptional regulator [Pseudoxanthomonas dokdonensis]KRG68812.1 LacI family transcriptional regulator [Pseudoxanthomonas dokdonensis]